MFTLKPYQSRALDALRGFFRQAGVHGAAEGWRRFHVESNPDIGDYDRSALGDVPTVCLRIPTGGGKTFLAANAIGPLGQVVSGTDAPVALWLVPSDAIRTQTLAALKAPTHPCREALQEAFGDRLRVVDLEELATVGPHELGHSAIVVVATIQSFNVRDRSKRNVYSFDEQLAPHFQAVTPAEAARLRKVEAADLVNQPFLRAGDIGRVTPSLANWLVLAKPLVIVDEAHNNRTEQAFQTLRELHPACVIELTATPPKHSNVLFHVGAMELRQEEMIKLPIVLTEHPDGWQAAVRDAVLTRRRLEELAAREDDYLRPIVLFQAQPSDGEATVKAVVEYLTSADGEALPQEHVAVATGSQKDLDGINLSDPGCPIRYVVTVEALKEGWDCPFAYVLCSLQDIRSAKDVEQLLGRVLRMPYARSRITPELNRAYAHVAKDSFSSVASQLVDRLVQNMGFERFEAAQAIVAPPSQGLLFNRAGSPLPAPADAGSFLELPAAPTAPVPASLASMIEIRPRTSGEATVLVRGPLTQEVRDFLTESATPKNRPSVVAALDNEQARLELLQAPSARGVPFAPLPQLCLELDGSLEPVDPRLLATLADFDLFTEPIALPAFIAREANQVIEIDVEGGRIRLGPGQATQLELNSIASNMTENDLVRWLDRECHQSDVGQASLLKWISKTVHHLVFERHLSITTLVRSRHLLKEATEAEIARRRRLAIARGFQAALPGFRVAPRLEDGFRFAFGFAPDGYPGKPPFYSGRYKFKKHYYAVIHGLREKTDAGQLAEEFLCAQAIDSEPRVKHWIRNVEREKTGAFWLPTATDLFYPDFVAELMDGRLLVVEYKGADRVDNADSREKRLVGEAWESSSGGKCLFLMAVERDQLGRDLPTQLAAKVA